MMGCLLQERLEIALNFSYLCNMLQKYNINTLVTSTKLKGSNSFFFKLVAGVCQQTSHGLNQ